jgi:hypothetical protein
MARTTAAAPASSESPITTAVITRLLVVHRSSAWRPRHRPPSGCQLFGGNTASGKPTQQVWPQLRADERLRGGADQLLNR